MKKYSFLHVTYDETQKDYPCLICCATNHEQIKMLVGYVGKGADEIYRIITEQSYLKEHDEQIRADERMKVMNETMLFVNKHSVEIGKREGIREFIEYLKKRHRYLELISIDELDFDLVEYEKEHKL